MKFRRRHDGKRRPQIDLIPMIDVTMFLLVFFMLFMTFKTDETGIEVDLPHAASGSQHVPANVVVTITQSGAIYVDGELSNLQSLQNTAADLIAVDPETTMTIRGDSRSFWEHAVGVMDAARQGGIDRFAFGTRSD